jgi:hypothetical protein
LTLRAVFLLPFRQTEGLIGRLPDAACDDRILAH